MSGRTVDPTLKTCDVCGKPLKVPSDGEIRILEVPFHALDDIRKIDEDIADELLQKDGRLAYHSDCTHPLHHYLPARSEPVRVSNSGTENPAENLVKCPVCRIPVSKSVGECGRCGHVFDG